MNFTDKAGLLAEVWVDFREDEQFKPFMEYNDIGVSMAYHIANGLVNPTPKGKAFVEESFDMLFKLINITEQEIDELDEVNLSAALAFALDKKQSEVNQPKATPIPIKYTDEGEQITIVVTCKSCSFKSYDEFYDFCPKCLKKIDYVSPVSE
jgi:hypothetical protein